jgi:hypothetical protein
MEKIMNLKNYNIYAGLSGGFGGVSYIGTLRNTDEKEAFDYAFKEACNIYDSYAGYHGIRSIEDIMDEEGVDENESEEIYIEERESWLDYYAVPTEEDTELGEKIFYL